MTGSHRHWAALTITLTAATSLFLLAPLIIVVIISFSSAQFLTFPPPGLSLKWYANLFGNVAWTNAFVTSLKVLVPSVTISTLIGTSAAYAVWQEKGVFGTWVSVLVMAPLVVPAIITGAALFFLFRAVGLNGSLISLVIGHSILTTPYVFVTVGTALKVVDPRLLSAAATLGAPPAVVFRRVVVPLIFPAIISGMLFASVMSFDELVVSLFLSTPRLRTITVQMWSNVTAEVDPTLAAVASLLFGFSLIALAANYLIIGLYSNRKRSRDRE